MARIWIVAVIGVLAIVDDLGRRRISNWIPIAAFLAGLFWQVAEHGWRGGVAGLLGALSGGAVFLIFYLLGGMGGGDIKLMAGFGALLGWKGILEAALWTAGCGGLMAAGLIGFRYLSSVLRQQSRVPAQAGADGSVQTQRSVQSMPYAPAIAAGVWLSLIPKT